MGKGQDWERTLCKRLSLWWSDGESDDMFWRTAGSGARATVRAKRGKTTRGHGSDITATCAEAEPFTRLFSIEAKRGYPKTSLHDVLDRSPRHKPTQYEQWVQQASEAAANQNSWSWMLITRRTRREALVIVPINAVDLLCQCAGVELFSIPHSIITLPSNDEVYISKFDDFLEAVEHEHVMHLYNHLKMKGHLWV